MTTNPHCLQPSSSLPALRTLRNVPFEAIIPALGNLQDVYCPLRLSPLALKDKHRSIEPVDSGYVSEDDSAEDDGDCAKDALALLRADEFEKSHTVRWLTGLIARVEELPFTEDQRAAICDQASFILASFTESSDDDEDHALTRDFTFCTCLAEEPVKISLNDAPLSTTDHTDVGLQSWGASIVFSSLMCQSPGTFGLDMFSKSASIIELGAGTGLISLTLAKLAPLLPIEDISITATDYHSAVLDNLRANIAMNSPTIGSTAGVIKANMLDWSCPPQELEASADMLLAADVVYAPEHARWLRDCAAHLLKPEGLFWLVVTVRDHGKFEGIPATAEAAFSEPTHLPRNGRSLKIMDKQLLAKQRGIGRDDENGYMLFKIGWAEA